MYLQIYFVRKFYFDLLICDSFKNDFQAFILYIFSGVYSPVMKDEFACIKKIIYIMFRAISVNFP